MALLHQMQINEPSNNANLRSPVEDNGFVGSSNSSDLELFPEEGKQRPNFYLQSGVVNPQPNLDSNANSPGPRLRKTPVQVNNTSPPRNNSSLNLSLSSLRPSTSNHPSTLHCFSQNVRSINSKLKDFPDSIYIC